jgi:hypothetical protein
MLIDSRTCADDWMWVSSQFSTDLMRRAMTVNPSPSADVRLWDGGRSRVNTYSLRLY